MNVKKSAEEDGETNSRNNVYIEYTSARERCSTLCLLIACQQMKEAARSCETLEQLIIAHSHNHYDQYLSNTYPDVLNCDILMSFCA
jgi:hypothetical protein